MLAFTLDMGHVTPAGAIVRRASSKGSSAGADQTMILAWNGRVAMGRS
jgi:hypothetical protein